MIKKTCKHCEGRGREYVVYDSKLHGGREWFPVTNAGGKPVYAFKAGSRCPVCNGKGTWLVGGTCGVPLIARSA